MHGLRRVDDIYSLDYAIPSEASSLAGRALVVVDLDRYPRKGFPFCGVAEVVNDYTEVIKDQASAINPSFVDSRSILELVHVSHDFKKYILFSPRGQPFILLKELANSCLRIRGTRFA